MLPLTVVVLLKPVVVTILVVKMMPMKRSHKSWLAESNTSVAQF
ncbi:hypothetical protein J2X88_006522 [Pseudomonas extremaustralis]|nr:hypothetical protein [Pseudomonas extremaustralis]